VTRRAKASVPDRGDIVWIDFNPQVGREQAERRPALVLSPASYNGKTGLAVVCPITNQQKGYPFEVPLPEGLEATGVVLSDQLKSLDWRGRHADIRGKAPDSLVQKVLERAITLLSPEEKAEEDAG
jgi:mRNA interferase MazF